MNSGEIALAPAYELCEQIATDEVSPVEVVEVFLERIAKLNPKLNVYLTVVSDARVQSHVFEGREVLNSILSVD